MKNIIDWLEDTKAAKIIEKFKKGSKDSKDSEKVVKES